MHGIGDGHAVFELAQVLRDGLIPGLQVALEHEPDDGAVAVGYLRDAVLRHQGLQARVLVGIAVAAIDHHGGRQIRRSVNSRSASAMLTAS